MKRKLLILLAVLLAIPVLFVLALFFYPRPVDHTPMSVYEGDGSVIDYCDLPELDGSGLMAKDIPQGHTPNCGYETFPMPILAQCTEPLANGATDMRGLWMSTNSDGRLGHIERVEQCGNRYVVTSSGLVHDMTTDGELSGASNDVTGERSIGPFNVCLRSSATTQWVDGRLEFYAMGLVHVVSRYMDGDQLKWDYPSFGTTTMDRICKVPQDD